MGLFKTQPTISEEQINKAANELRLAMDNVTAQDKEEAKPPTEFGKPSYAPVAPIAETEKAMQNLQAQQEDFIHKKSDLIKRLETEIQDHGRVVKGCKAYLEAVGIHTPEPAQPTVMEMKPKAKA